MEVKNDLKEFVQIIQNKICIGMAIAVIKSKPSHLSARKYAEEIQEQLMQNWIQKEETSVFDDKILEIQQDRIFDQITDILDNGTSFETFSPQSSSDVEVYKGDFCSELALSDEQDFSWSNSSDSESDESTGIESQANFMKAMVQLKFVVESCKVIPVDKAYSCLYDKALKMKSIRDSEEVVKNNNLSEDSGFGESNSVPQESNLIPSSVFRYLTHSFKTEALVHKCISSLLSFTEHSLINKPEECFKFWKGSVLERLVSVLKEVSDHPICSESLSMFITRILENIWDTDQINKLTICNYQIVILTEFCSNKHVCESVINFLMAKMSSLSSKLSEENFYYPDKLCEIHLIEKMPFFITLLQSVLRKWKEASTTPALLPNAEKIDRNITELWKKKWCGIEEESNSTTFQDPSIVREWKCICDKLITTSAVQFPLISISLCEVSDFISTLIHDT